MRIPVGPFDYTLKLVLPPLKHPDGREVVGLCDPDRLEIMIRADLPPVKRWSVFCHELAHAWAALDPRHDDIWSEETLAELVGVALARMDALAICRLHVLLNTGIDAREVILPPFFSHPIPVVRLGPPADHMPLPNHAPTMRA